MMNTKTLIAFFLVGIFSQLFYITDAKSINPVQPLDLQEDGEQLLNELETKLNEELQRGEHVINVTLTDLKKYFERTKQEGENRINNESDKLIQTLNEIKQDAENNGLDITSCLGSNEQEILNLAEKVMEKVNLCANNRYINAIYDLNDTLAEIKTFPMTVQFLREVFEDCPDDDCRNIVYTIIKEVFYDEVLQLAPQEVFLQTFGTEQDRNIFLMCYIDGAFDVYNGYDLLDDIEKCINDLGK